MITAPALTTRRFLLRKLEVGDVGEHYLAWLSDQGAHIAAIRTKHTMASLIDYVAHKSALADVVFLGIFELSSGRHIGNVKFEPIDVTGGYAVFGILIGDEQLRGKGVAGEVIAATAAWLKTQGITEIVLGVDIDNAAAIRAYDKAGFRIGDTPHLPEVAQTYRMILSL